MVVYLTLGDQPSGIFNSQVLDLVNFLNSANTETRLISFVSIRNFFETKRIIRQRVPNAYVIPMIPGLHNWSLNRFFLNYLCRKLRPRVIYGRSVLATALALQTKEKFLSEKVVYDGRGAIAAEWNEYEVVQNGRMRHSIEDLEKFAVCKSDFRIAVSYKLIDYWQTRFGCGTTGSFVIPCTLDKIYENFKFDHGKFLATRQRLGLPADVPVLVFSGSASGWHSFRLLTDSVRCLLLNQPKLCTLFLAPENSDIQELKNEFPDRIFQQYVRPHEVPQILSSCDYGLLIREMSVTNQVASPVKFAEYLACGLKIIISEGLGDFSDVINTNNIGINYNRMTSGSNLPPLSPEERQSNHDFAIQHYTKARYVEVYNELNNK